MCVCVCVCARARARACVCLSVCLSARARACVLNIVATASLCDATTHTHLVSPGLQVDNPSDGNDPLDSRPTPPDRGNPVNTICCHGNKRSMAPHRQTLISVSSQRKENGRRDSHRVLTMSSDIS